jgi:hypothetical protein
MVALTLTLTLTLTLARSFLEGSRLWCALNFRQCTLLVLVKKIDGP